MYKSDKKDVTQALRVQQKPLPTKSKSHGVIWASGGEEYDENYDVYEHLDKVPITMPPPLGPQDYTYTPYRCSGIFNAHQDSTNLQPVSSQTSLLEQENQQLKIQLLQLQNEYSKVNSLNMGLNQQYSEEFKDSVNDKVLIVNQQEEIAQLKNHLVTLQEKYDRLKEHENLVCDKYNSLIPQFNLKISACQKTIKDLHHDNYLLNKVLEKISPESDLNKRLNSSVESDDSEDTSINYHQDSASQTDFNYLINNSKTISNDSSIQTNLTQSNINSGTQTNIISHHTPSSPKNRPNNLPSRRTSPQPNIPVNQIKITTNFKRFRCAWCSEEKHAWDKCNQWNSWNLGQKQQALQILDNVKRGKLPSPVSIRPHFHPQQKLPVNPTKVRSNRESLSRVQWEKQVKINENVQKCWFSKNFQFILCPTVQCS